MKPPQSLAGYIRQHLTELESRLEVGIRQEVIVSELEAHGYKTTLKGFRNFLYRARLRRAAKNAVAAPPNHLLQQEITTERFATERTKNEVKNRESLDSKNTEKEDEIAAETGSLRPTDLDAIQEQEVDLRSLAKLAKRNRN